jgi:hypothetical protein
MRPAIDNNSETALTIFRRELKESIESK